MKREQRRRLQNALTLVSFLAAGVGTAFWIRIRIGGGVTPLWLMAVVGYGWIFVAFLGINLVAHTFSRKKRYDPPAKK
ncbi:MAG: hypothetical protein ACXVP5_04355 [Tumebacillaceae bacterium]